MKVSKVLTRSIRSTISRPLRIHHTPIQVFSKPQTAFWSRQRTGHIVETPNGYNTGRRSFHNSHRLNKVKSVVLTDIGEGTTEAQIVQWFVKEGAAVKEWDRLCEVATDKALTDISSKYDGVVKKLHYHKDDIAKVGSPLYDIDVTGEESTEEFESVESPKEEMTPELENKDLETTESVPNEKPSGKHATLATPAVRHLSKQLGVDIAVIQGTGKDGRVLKEDLQRYAASNEETGTKSETPTSSNSTLDEAKSLTPFQTQMFKTMTKSLSIPHFLFTDSISLNSLSALRKSLKLDPHSPLSISPLPFFVKAISLGLTEYPLLNSHLDTSGTSPLLTQRSAHNFGIAIDTPAGLIVPVLRDVQNKTVATLSSEIADLASKARQGKLSQSDLKGATFTISNVGSISGGVVAPVITAPQVGIVGIGRSRTVPAFDQNGNVIKREEVTLSWSADHRVVDGAMVARAAETVKILMEDVGKMLLRLR